MAEMVEVDFVKADLRRMLDGVSRFNLEIIGIKEPCGPCTLNKARAEFRAGHLREEVQEFLDASADENIPQAADALMDLIYVALGALYEMGVAREYVFEEVQRANMERTKGRKARAVQDDLDAVKPEGWRPPDHSWLDHLSPVLVEACRIRASKTQDYDGDDLEKGDYFPFRELSHAQMLWTKVCRIRSLAKAAYRARLLGGGHAPNHEGLRDSVVDLINYSTYFAEDLDGVLRRSAL